jgi:quinol monooxygenase YgiN
MSIVRQYQMTPSDGRFADLVSALIDLAAKVRALPGSEQVTVLSALDNSHVAFVEQWTSVEAHKSAGALLGASAFDPVMALLADKPKGSYLQIVAVEQGSAGV